MTPRVFVLGLDGMSPAVWRLLSEAGALPALSRYFLPPLPLMSTVPAHTAPAWTSIATGLTPGEHGVLDFWHRPAGMPQPLAKRPLVTRAHAPFFWEVAHQHGAGVGVFNYPLSYPPTPVKGYWVCGLNAPPGTRNAVYPASVADVLSNFKADADEVGVDLFGARPMTLHQRTRALQMLTELLQNHLDCGQRLIRQQAGEVQLFVHILTVTDRFLHLFWDVVHTPEHTLYKAAMAFWRTLDVGVAGWLDLAKPDVVLLVSDHGFTDSPTVAVNLDRWASDAGLVKPVASQLRLSASLKAALKALLPGKVQHALRQRAQARALSRYHTDAPLGLEVIYGPWVGVTFSPKLDAYGKAELTKRLRAAAERLVNERGMPVFQAAQPASEIWHGAYLSSFPEWVLTLADGFGSAIGSFDKRMFIPTRSVRTGDHHPEGILAASIPLPDKANWQVWDVSALVLSLLGMTQDQTEGANSSVGVLSSEQDTELIAQRLRRLGYMA